jgi:hypothetical protein
LTTEGFDPLSERIEQSLTGIPKRSTITSGGMDMCTYTKEELELSNKVTEQVNWLAELVEEKQNLYNEGQYDALAGYDPRITQVRLKIKELRDSCNHKWHTIHQTEYFTESQCVVCGVRKEDHI